MLHISEFWFAVCCLLEVTSCYGYLLIILKRYEPLLSHIFRCHKSCRNVEQNVLIILYFEVGGMRKEAVVAYVNAFPQIAWRNWEKYEKLDKDEVSEITSWLNFRSLALETRKLFGLQVPRRLFKVPFW